VTIEIIGPGRAGTTIFQRARAVGIDCRLGRDPDAVDPGVDAVVLAVPDGVVADCAAAVPDGPRIGTLAGSVPLDCLGARTGRFILHPMQTLVADGGPDQLVGATAGITADEPATAVWVGDLATALGMRPLAVPDACRPLPHLACVFASNLLIAPLVAATRTLRAAGFDAAATAAALTPLALRAVELALAEGTDAQPTGPLARGDADTIRRHRRVLVDVDPALEHTYRTLSHLALEHVPTASADAVAPVLMEPIGVGT
jgi:predicted short-subunit dehydrogenase-like oxidoreductase (DUF2520 family)